MNALLLGLLAETNVHAGAGGSGGLIDLPVAREAATDYPYVPGSSLKGALSQWSQNAGLDDRTRKRLFGEQENAGTLLVSDLRLLLLPIRSLDTAYKWATCPHLIERLGRDSARTGTSETIPAIEIKSGEYCGEPIADDLPLFLEERQFRPSLPLPASVVPLILRLLPTGSEHANTRSRLSSQLVVIDDGDFVWFCRNGLSVAARNVLNERSKISENLWYEESLPSDTLLYAIIAERVVGALDDLRRAVTQQRFIQVGGNETVGMGWLTMRLVGAPQ